MEKFNAIKIISITLAGFRGFSGKISFDFDDTTFITGSNGKGKSSIAHAVAFALFGTTFFGETNNNRLTNKQSKKCAVQLDFIDEKGQQHSLYRGRRGDKTTLIMDTYSVKQSDIDRMVCERDVFLSVFNPLYFIEPLGDKGRELLERYLPSISKDEVLNELSNYDRKALSNADFQSPENTIKDIRKKTRNINDSLAYLEGQIDTVATQIAEVDVKYAKAADEKVSHEKKLMDLQEKQFKGIDTDALAAKQNELLQNLPQNQNFDSHLSEVIYKLEVIKAKQYDSKFRPELEKITARINQLAENYKSIQTRLDTLQIGDQCPTCFLQVSPQNIVQIRKQLQAELESIEKKGHRLAEERKALLELDKDAKEKFAEFKAADIEAAEAEIANIQKTSLNPAMVRNELERIDEQLRLGNLNEQEFCELNLISTDIAVAEGEMKANDKETLQKQLNQLEGSKKDLEQAIVKNNVVVSALVSYITKRTELILDELNMPNVRFVLFEVVRSSGEVKNTFKFSYKGLDYRCLSLSEKIRAGIEMSALLRKLCNVDYPVFIDNTESITGLAQDNLPSQVFLSKVAKNCELTVIGRSNNQELKKAG